MNRSHLRIEEPDPYGSADDPMLPRREGGRCAWWEAAKEAACVGAWRLLPVAGAFGLVALAIVIGWFARGALAGK